MRYFVSQNSEAVVHFMSRTSLDKLETEKFCRVRLLIAVTAIFARNGIHTSSAELDSSYEVYLQERHITILLRSQI